jgi:biopolymer transport protein ExbB/TolQ
MNDNDWTGVIFGMGVLILCTIILIVVLIVAERFYRARAQRQDLVKLTALVEKYEQTAAASADHQRSATADFAEMRTRLESIERLLREVE